MFLGNSVITILLSIASYSDITYAHPRPADAHPIQKRRMKLNPVKPAAMASTCPATDNRVPLNGQNGQFRPGTENRLYPLFTYTKGQVEAALRAGAQEESATWSQPYSPSKLPINQNKEV